MGRSGRRDTATRRAELIGQLRACAPGSGRRAGTSGGRRRGDPARGDGLGARGESPAAFDPRSISPGRRCSSVTNAPVCSRVAPCQPSAARVSVPRGVSPRAPGGPEADRQIGCSRSRETGDEGSLMPIPRSRRSSRTAAACGESRQLREAPQSPVSRPETVRFRAGHRLQRLPRTTGGGGRCLM